MKMKLVYISMVLIFALSVSCSNSTSPDTPPLGDFLYGTYDNPHTMWSPNSNGNPKYKTAPTELTYLTINSNGSYSMRLELYVGKEDTTFNIYQEGSYVTMGTEYVQPNGGVDHWKGTLEFRPEEQTVWQVDFLIYKNINVITFNINVINYQNVNEFLFELPNSGGFIWVLRWHNRT